jgi:quercetin dioxygenase-like cupin family protein
MPVSARRSGCLLLIAFLLAGSAAAQPVRVIRFSEAKPFRMGDVTSMRIIHPGLGAKKTTLNYSVSRPGAEFAQHVHDESDDTILVLQGEVNLKQGDALRLFRAGECAFVPTGQIHGTVTAGTGEAIMISFQNPPDFVLYTGARDSKKTGQAPKGIITPGAVKYLNYAKKNGLVTSPAMGSQRAQFFHRKLKQGASFKAAVATEGEGFFFVKSGSISVKDGANTYEAGEQDTVFLNGPAAVEVTASAPDTIVIHVQAPPAVS